MYSVDIHIHSDNKRISNVFSNSPFSRNNKKLTFAQEDAGAIPIEEIQKLGINATDMN